MPTLGYWSKYHSLKPSIYQVIKSHWLYTVSLDIQFLRAYGKLKCVWGYTKMKLFIITGDFQRSWKVVFYQAEIVELLSFKQGFVI